MLMTKMSIPTMVVMYYLLTLKKEVSNLYPDAFFDDLAKAYREEIDELYSLGLSEQLGYSTKQLNDDDPRKYPV